MAELQQGESTRGSPALEGVRVVALGHDLAVAVTGMLLAEQGAEVVRVTGGAPVNDDPVLEAVVSRGTVTATLEVAAAKDRATLQGLVAHADVVLDGGPHGATGGFAAWGLDPATLRTGGCPGLVSCSLPAFVAGDPREDLPAYEAVVGMAGMLYSKPLGKPRYHDLPIASIISGLFAASAIVAALVVREATGQGQEVEVPRHHATLFSQVLHIFLKTGVPRGFLPLKMVGTPFMRSWQCADDRYIYLHITLPAHNARILEMLEEHGYAPQVEELRDLLSEETRRDPSQVKSIPEAKAVRAVYEEIFLTKSADEWEALLGQELCCIKVRTVEEWLRDSRAAGMADACTVNDPVFGEVWAPGPAVTVANHPPLIKPRTSGDAVEMLQAWSAAAASRATKTEVAGAAVPRHPLSGVRILDLSRVIAGPCAARVLGELGADVLSVQNPTSLDWALSFHLIFNAGKRSVTVDFTTDEGKEKLWAIIDEFKPHVVIQNYRHLDLAREIGVGPEAFRERFPDIVYLHLNAYGDLGVWRDRPGFEQVVQAVSGIQLTYARSSHPRLLPTPVIDIGSGLMGALAVLLGLYHHRRTGEGIVATTHLTRMSVLLQIVSIAASQRDRCLAAADATGTPANHDPARGVVAEVLLTRDGWVCVTGPRRAVGRWLRHAGLTAEQGSLADQLTAAHLWHRSSNHWRRQLKAAGVADEVVVIHAPRPKALTNGAADGVNGANGDPGTRHETAAAAPPDAPPGRWQAPLVTRQAFPGCPTPLALVRTPVTFSLTPLKPVTPPPERGGNTREVLAALGEHLPPNAGVVPYPENKPVLTWLAEVIRWGYFAWRSGNI